nr:RimK-like ATP-grasp domain protein [uncultured bacterium]
MVPNMQLVKEVCEEEGLPFELMGGHPNLAEVIFAGKSYFFSYAATPFNTEDVQRISADKFLTYSLVASKIRMPKTEQYLRPDLDPELHGEIKYQSEEEIVDHIKRNFPFPLIVKMNGGSQGKNVFKCSDERGVEIAVKKIFADDWALLAQELILREKEFRVTIVNNVVELVYTKGGFEFFQKNSKAFEEMENFLSPLKNLINLGWAGLDVIEDKEGKLCLIEINTKPSFESAVKHGQKEILKPLYKKAFHYVLQSSSLQVHHEPSFQLVR